MLKIIFDTTIVLEFPELLSYRSDNFCLIIPNLVLGELSRIKLSNNSIKNYIELIKTAIAQDFAELHIIGSVESINIKNSSDISYNNATILNWAKRLIQNKEEIILATNDLTLRKEAELENVPTKNSKELKKYIKDIASQSYSLSSLATKAITKKKKYILINLMVSILAGFTVNYFYSNFKSILENINIWGTIIGIPLLGILLYWLRSKFRIAYGLSEFFVGWIISLRIFFPSYDYSQIIIYSFLQILGGFILLFVDSTIYLKVYKGQNFQKFGLKYFKVYNYQII